MNKKVLLIEISCLVLFIGVVLTMYFTLRDLKETVDTTEEIISTVEEQVQTSVMRTPTVKAR